MRPFKSPARYGAPMASFWSGQDVFLTGGTGGLGSHLARLLLGLGADVTVLTRDASRASDLEEAGVDVVEGDITDRSSIPLEQTDVVIHGGAWVAYGIPPNKKDLFHRTNVEGTKNVLQEAKDADADRFCHVSSTAAIGPTPAGLYGEDRAVDRRFPTYLSSYAETKHKAHVHVLEEHEPLRTTLAMPSVVLGRGTFTEPLMRRFADGMRFSLDGDTPTGFVHLEDTVDGILAAIEEGEGPYVFNDLNLTIADLFDVFQEASGIPAPTRKVPIGLFRAWAGLVETPYHLLGKVPPLSSELVDSLEKPHTYSAARAHEELGFNPSLEAHLSRDFDEILDT